MKTAAHISLFRVVLAIAVMDSCHVLQAASPSPPNQATPSTEGMSEEALKQLAELDKFDPLDPRRADVLERLAQQSRTTKDRNMWYQQMS